MKAETERTLLNNVAVGNWNSNQINILTWESARQLDLQPRFTIIRLLEQEDFCGVITLTCFVESFLHLP